MVFLPPSCQNCCHAVWQLPWDIAPWHCSHGRNKDTALSPLFTEACLLVAPEPSDKVEKLQKSLCAIKKTTLTTKMMAVSSSLSAVETPSALDTAALYGGLSWNRHPRGTETQSLVRYCWDSEASVVSLSFLSPEPDDRVRGKGPGLICHLSCCLKLSWRMRLGPEAKIGFPFLSPWIKLSPPRHRRSHRKPSYSLPHEGRRKHVPVVWTSPREKFTSSQGSECVMTVYALSSTI